MVQASQFCLKPEKNDLKFEFRQLHAFVFTFLIHLSGKNFVVKLILQSILYFVSQKVCASQGCPININVHGNGGTKVIKTILFSSLDAGDT